MNWQDKVASSELITWVDVARRLAYVVENTGGPAVPVGVLTTEVYWSGLNLRVQSAHAKTEAINWLKHVFGSWLLDDEHGGLRFRLSAPEGMSTLNVRFEIAGDHPAQPPVFKPSAALSGDREFAVSFPVRPESNSFPVYAFHSVKGGVGRTTSTICFATNQASDPSRPILVVDADFEAPGISYLSEKRKSSPSISLEDLIALAHADPSDGFEKTIDFVSRRMADQRIDDIFVLPVKRTLEDLLGFAIRPENLLSARSGQTYVLVDLIRAIAQRLGCSAAIIDLRAGLVDVALHFLTDPSVERIFVTTASGQSIAALKSMIATLGLIERQTGVACRQPFVILNQIPIYRITDVTFRTDIISDLLNCAEENFKSDQMNGSSKEAALSFGFIPHLSDLIAASDSWDAYLAQLNAASLPRLLQTEMRSWTSLEKTFVANEKALPTAHLYTDNDRQKLFSFADRLEVAETAPEISLPLITPPLQRLASDFISQVPIVVVEGAKGTGKTLTFRYLLEKGFWSSAISELGGAASTTPFGPFLPLFGSVANNSNLLDQTYGARVAVSSYLGGQTPSRFSETEQNLKDKLKKHDQNTSWMSFWLAEIAAAAGFRGKEAWNNFVEATRSSNTSPIILIEGLEEVLTDPFKSSDQAAALLSLLREVPLRLREEAERPVGLILFVRADMVEATIAQNLAQFRAAYANYALTWRDVDIKELVVWLVDESGAIPGIWSDSWRKQSGEQQERDLRKIWGWKLGTDESREARSTEWVISVLTDLTGRLTARDLVRFIGEAARNSKGQDQADRLLSAAAVKNAVEGTSRKKVEEYPKEVRQLGDIFKKFISNPNFETPFRRFSAVDAGITDEDLTTLEKYGVLYQEDGVFEVPELFRIGLEMKRVGARPNIISLTRRARERARA